MHQAEKDPVWISTSSIDSKLFLHNGKVSRRPVVFHGEFTGEQAQRVGRVFFSGAFFWYLFCCCKGQLPSSGTGARPPLVQHYKQEAQYIIGVAAVAQGELLFMSRRCTERPWSARFSKHGPAWPWIYLELFFFFPHLLSQNWKSLRCCLKKKKQTKKNLMTRYFFFPSCLSDFSAPSQSLTGSDKFCHLDGHECV